jgi:hypothetical protein
MDRETVPPGVEVMPLSEVLLVDTSPALVGDGKRGGGQPAGGCGHLLVTVSLTRWTLGLLDTMSARDLPPKRSGRKKQRRSATLRRLVVAEAQRRGLVR